MSFVSQILFWGLIGLIAIQAALVFGFVWRLSRFRPARLPDSECPPATVVLCLRGPDPFLSECVEAILAQDYPHYEVRVVIDHRDDPAWAIVEGAVNQRNATGVTLMALENPKSTCTLKCSAIVQAVAGLSPSSEFIAQLDADVVPHRTWLRELAGGLIGENVGAATGNRWYMPDHPSVGSLVRYIWNAGAVVQMCWFKIAWGGTLAIKTRLLRETDLLERWSKAFGEDTPLFSILRRSGLTMRFVPSLMMGNRETCEFGSFCRWVRRQMLSSRLHHPGFYAVICHAMSTLVVAAASLATVLFACVLEEWQAAYWLIAGLVIYQFAMFSLLAVLESAMKRIFASRGERTQSLTMWGWLATIGLIPLTQIVYAGGLISSLLLRRIDWRGVEYKIDGSSGIHLVEYRPYAASRTSERGPHSL